MPHISITHLYLLFNSTCVKLLSIFLIGLFVVIAVIAFQQKRCDLNRVKSDTLQITQYSEGAKEHSWTVSARNQIIEVKEIKKIACSDEQLGFDASQAVFQSAAFSELMTIKHLQLLDISGASIPSDELPALQGSNDLKHLYCGPLPRDCAFAWIENCESLRDLTFHSASCSEEQIEAILKLGKLQSLTLLSPDLKQWRSLDKLSSLKRLSLVSCRLHPTFWLQVKEMQSLEKLQLLRCTLADEDFAAIVATKRAIEIEIAYSQLPNTLSAWRSSLQKKENVYFLPKPKWNGK